MHQATIERELKLGAWPGFELPDLRRTIDGVAPSAPEEWRLEAVYFDTADLRLLRRGVTLRFRRGEEPGDVWTVKLPDAAPALGLARREISVAAGSASMPPLLEDLVRGWALGAPLVPVARLRTLRSRTTLRRPGGQAVAVVDDDEVSIIQRSRVAARFRELELELLDGAPSKLLQRLDRRVRSAGAQPVEQIPKLVRALGPSALAPWDLAPAATSSPPTAAEMVTAALTGAAAHLVDHVAAVVLDEDLEGVHQSRVAARFRELELELLDGAPSKLLQRLDRRVRSAGAQPVEQIPKLVRALGPSALAPWDLAAAALSSPPTAAEMVTAALTGAAAHLVDHVAAVVLDEDLEGVHQSRVAIRRLRSDLRTAAPLLDAPAVEPLRHELSWLMSSLGEVRDLDVLVARLRGDVERLESADRPAAHAVLEQAQEDRAAAYERLRADLRTPRCASLLEEMARIAVAPPFTGRSARKPAAKVLPRLVHRPVRDLRREVRRRGGEPDDEGLHRIRIKVKRARYAAELAGPAVGRKARRAARKLAKVQDVLGEHHDACMAVERLRDLGERTGQTGAWASGLLGGLAVARAADCRGRFGAVWADAAGAKLWRWTK